MSTTSQRDHTYDKYTVLSTFDADFATTENSFVQALVQRDISINTVGTTYTSASNSQAWNSKAVDGSFVNTSAIFNYPNATVTERSVLYSGFNTDDVGTDSYTDNNINALNNPCNLSSLPTSSVFYDTNYTIDTSFVATCYDNQGGETATATFDVTDENINMEYALQSRYNTKLNQTLLTDFTVDPKDPMMMYEDVEFNTYSALGMQGYVNDNEYNSMWCDINSNVTGGVTFNTIDASFQPNNNQMNVYIRNGVYGLDPDTDVGIFKIETAGEGIVTTAISDGSYNNSIYTDQNLSRGPIFNGGPLFPITL